MFANNSRYATVPTSSPVDAKGETLLGTNVRFTPLSVGTFQHTVLQRDRLDLLAVKYYGDPTKWWQVCDANPKFLLPTDLLDRSPIAEEVLILASPSMQSRFDQLLNALTTTGETVRFPVMELSESSLVVLQMTPAIRAQTITAITSQGFHFLKSFAWSDGVTTGELFYFEDIAAKQDWRDLLQELTSTTGIVSVSSMVEGSTIRVVYNTAVIAREQILAISSRRSFEPVLQASQQIVRLGARIVVPPNTVS
jgi:hypothetical protein